MATNERIQSLKRPVLPTLSYYLTFIHYFGFGINPNDISSRHFSIRVGRRTETLIAAAAVAATAAASANAPVDDQWLTDCRLSDHNPFSSKNKQTREKEIEVSPSRNNSSSSCSLGTILRTIVKFTAISFTTFLTLNHCIVLIDYIYDGSKAFLELMLEVRLVITKFSALIFVLSWHRNQSKVRQLIKLVKSTSIYILGTQVSKNYTNKSNNDQSLELANDLSNKYYRQQRVGRKKQNSTNKFQFDDCNLLSSSSPPHTYIKRRYYGKNYSNYNYDDFFHVNQKNINNYNKEEKKDKKTRGTKKNWTLASQKFNLTKTTTNVTTDDEESISSSSSIGGSSSSEGDKLHSSMSKIDHRILRWWLMCVFVTFMHFSLSEAEISSSYSHHLWQWLDDYSLHRLNNQTISNSTLMFMASFDNYIYTVHVYGTRLIGASIICIVCSLQRENIDCLRWHTERMIKKSSHFKEIERRRRHHRHRHHHHHRELHHEVGRSQRQQQHFCVEPPFYQVATRAVQAVNKCNSWIASNYTAAAAAANKTSSTQVEAAHERLTKAKRNYNCDVGDAANFTNNNNNNTEQLGGGGSWSNRRRQQPIMSAAATEVELTTTTTNKMFTTQARSRVEQQQQQQQQQQQVKSCGLNNTRTTTGRQTKLATIRQQQQQQQQQQPGKVGSQENIDRDLFFILGESDWLRVCDSLSKLKPCGYLSSSLWFAKCWLSNQKWRPPPPLRKNCADFIIRLMKSCCSCISMQGSCCCCCRCFSISLLFQWWRQWRHHNRIKATTTSDKREVQMGNTNKRLLSLQSSQSSAPTTSETSLSTTTTTLTISSTQVVESSNNILSPSKLSEFLLRNNNDYDDDDDDGDDDGDELMVATSEPVRRGQQRQRQRQRRQKRVTPTPTCDSHAKQNQTQTQIKEQVNIAGQFEPTNRTTPLFSIGSLLSEQHQQTNLMMNVQTDTFEPTPRATATFLECDHDDDDNDMDMDMEDDYDDDDDDDDDTSCDCCYSVADGCCCPTPPTDLSNPPMLYSANAGQQQVMKQVVVVARETSDNGQTITALKEAENIEWQLERLASKYELVRTVNARIDSCFGPMLLIQYSFLFLMSCIDLVYFSICFNPNTKTKLIIVSGMILLWWPYLLLYKFASDIGISSKELLISVRRLARLSLIERHSSPISIQATPFSSAATAGQKGCDDLISSKTNSNEEQLFGTTAHYYDYLRGYPMSPPPNYHSTRNYLSHQISCGGGGGGSGGSGSGKGEGKGIGIGKCKGEGKGKGKGKGSLSRAAQGWPGFQLPPSSMLRSQRRQFAEFPLPSWERHHKIWEQQKQEQEQELEQEQKLELEQTTNTRARIINKLDHVFEATNLSLMGIMTVDKFFLLNFAKIVITASVMMIQFISN